MYDSCNGIGVVCPDRPPLPKCWGGEEIMAEYHTRELQAWHATRQALQDHCFFSGRVVGGTPCWIWGHDPECVDAQTANDRMPPLWIQCGGGDWYGWPRPEDYVLVPHDRVRLLAVCCWPPPMMHPRGWPGRFLEIASRRWIVRAHASCHPRCINPEHAIVSRAGTFTFDKAGHARFIR